LIGLTASDEATSVADDYGVSVVAQDGELRAIEVAGSPASLRRAQLRVGSDPRLRYVEPNSPLSVQHQRNDPLTFTVDPSTAHPFEWSFGAMHVDTALNLTKGDPNLIVGIVDSGFAQVPDLSGKYEHGWYFSNETTTPFEDDNGHGTFVASVLASNNDDGQGLAGFCGGCRLDVFRVVNLNTLTVGTAVRRLADDGVRIISLSLGSPNDNYFLDDAISYAISKGALIVVAAGNEGAGTVDYPAAFVQPSGGAPSYGLAVGATDSSGNRASFSNYGNNLSLVAPGIPIIGALPSNPVTIDSECGPHFTDSTTGARYAYCAGTSLSTPEVAGVAALVWAASPSLASWQVANIVKQSAERPSGAGWTSDMGWGLVDAAKALELATGKSSADSVTLTTPVISGSAAPGGNISVSSAATWQDGTPIPQGTVSCAASAGDRTLRNTTGQLDDTGTASCDWPIPPGTAGKTLRGTIQVTDTEGNSATIPFTTRVLDTQAPVATPLRSQGFYGHVVSLRYRLSDDSSLARLRIDILKGLRLFATISKPLLTVSAGRTYTVGWHAPAAPKHPPTWMFCLTGTDAAGNASHRRCTSLHLR
jgi:subtilisin family serine protease